MLGRGSGPGVKKGGPGVYNIEGGSVKYNSVKWRREEKGI